MKTIPLSSTTIAVVDAARELAYDDPRKFGEILREAKISRRHTILLGMLWQFDRKEMETIYQGYGEADYQGGFSPPNDSFERILEKQGIMLGKTKKMILEAIENIRQGKSPEARFKPENALEYLAHCLYEANE